MGRLFLLPLHCLCSFAILLSYFLCKFPVISLAKNFEKRYTFILAGVWFSADFNV